MGTLWLWIGFIAFVLVLLALDLGVFHRRVHAVSIREAALWTVVWVVLALLFNAFVWHWYGSKRGLEFFTGYLIEKSLSMDNIFVFAMLFRYFGVAARLQHRVLFWGIIGALIMRGAMIAVGVTLIQRFHWVLYIFGAFLIYAGWKMMRQKAEEVHPERNPIFRWARKYLPMSQDHTAQSFFVRHEGIWRATPLFLVLLAVETTDLVFALDSIPAIFGITTDPFIVFTSNVFAILGLRALYFVLVGVLAYFRHLSTGLAVVLMFIGVKMLIEHWLKIGTGISLAIVAGILATAIVASLAAARAEEHASRKTKMKESQGGTQDNLQDERRD